mgnify:FL=1
MANFELYLRDFYNQQKCSINKTLLFEHGTKEAIEIVFYDNSGEITHSMYLDKSTAIKFAKTLRTEINKIIETESLIDGGSDFKTLQKGNFTTITGQPRKGGNNGRK